MIVNIIIIAAFQTQYNINRESLDIFFLDASRPPKMIYIIHTQKVVQTSLLLRSEEKWKTTGSQNLFGVSKKTLGVTK